MKNKINLNQLYESCKKWKTLVLLGAMLLIGINQMWATAGNIVYFNNSGKSGTPHVYYWGGSPSTTWDGCPEMYQLGTSDIYYYDIGSNSSFKVRYGNNMSSSTSDLGYNDGNYHDGSNHKCIVFFDNTSANWSSLTAYTYNNNNNKTLGEWPGTAMTALTGVSNIYYIAAGSDDKIIFNCGSNSCQTGDLDFVKGALYNKNGKVSDTYEPAPPTFTVIYDDNGKTSGSVPTDESNPYDSGSTVTVLGNTGNLAKTGYHFVGWNTAADYSGFNYTAGATFSISANTRLYAKWVKTIYVYTSWSPLKLYTWDSGNNNKEYSGSWSGTEIYEIGSSDWFQVDIVSGPDKFILNKNSGDNDNKTSNLNISEYADGGSYYINNSTSPRGLSPKTLTVTVNMHGHDVSYSSYAGSYNYNALLTEVTEPSASGYSFDGWFKEDSYTNEWDFENDHITSDVTLHAKWTSTASDYQVTYGVGTSYTSMGTLTAYDNTADDDLDPSPATVDVGNSITFTATPAQDYYEVDAWYTNAECSTGEHDAGSTTYNVASLDEDISVYVKFKLIDYTITYKDNGNTDYSGDNSGSLIASYNYGTGVANLVAGSKTGYTFGGWYSNPSCTGDAVTSISNTSTGAKTFYAKWTAKTYTVNLDQQSGTGGSTSITATFGSAMPAATMPEKDGYDFGGYFTSSGGSGTPYYNANGTSAHSWDIDVNPSTLFAYWVPEATWYLYGDGFGGWSRGTDYPLDQRYRGIAGIYYREVVGESNYYFKVHDGSAEYGHPGGDQTITINGDSYSYATAVQYGSFYRTIPSGTTVWFVINTNNSTLWIMSPLHDIDVTSANGTVTMSATDAKTSQTVTGTQFASGETVSITVTPTSGYQISSVTFNGTPIVAVSEDGYAKTYSVTMPNSNSTLVATYEEIPPEWKMYNGATLLGTFIGSGPYTAIINHTAGNSSNQWFDMNGTAYQLAADCQLTSEQTLSTGSTQHAWTTDDYGYYRVSISTPDEGSTWKVQATRVYAVTYDGNGNTSGDAPADAYYAVGETIITATKGDLEKDDLHFYRWNTAADGSGNHYAESASAGTMTSAGLNLYAEWEDLSTGWTICGGSLFGGDDPWWNQRIPLTKMSGHTSEDIGYYTISISGTNAEGGNTAYNFKVQDPEDHWFGIATDEHKWDWLYKRNYGIQPMMQYDTNSDNVQICSDLAGDYVIKVDYSDAANPTVEIIFPVTGTYNVTLESGSHGSVSNPGSLTIHQYPKVAITATPEPGYRFVNWTVDGGHSSYISFDNANSATTNVWATDAAGDGATITANFTNEGFVYFDRTALEGVWSGDKVYVTLLQDYDLTWNNDNKSLIVTNWVNEAVHNKEMTRIPYTNIYYFNFNGYTPGNKILFTDKPHPTPGQGYLTLHQMAAAVEWDFSPSNNNMFVAENYCWKSANEVGYYDGYWMKYNETNSGLELKIYAANNELIATESFTAPRAGEREFTASHTLSSQTLYKFEIHGLNGKYYKKCGSMTNTDCTDKAFFSRDERGVNGCICTFTTTGAGSYKYTLNCTDYGQLKVSLEFPLDVNDYRVVYQGKIKEGATSSCHTSDFIRHLTSAGSRKDTLSFYVRENWSLQLERCSLLTPETWVPEGASISKSDFEITDNGVYTFIVEQTHDGSTNTVTITKGEKYTGDYYIRTSASGGGWEAYKTTPNNKLIYSNYSKQHSGYDYYYCSYRNGGTNVKFTIANDYSSCITDTVEADSYVSSPGNLPGDASVRFMYNNATNVISRAYLNGSSTTDFLLLEAKNDSIKELNDDAISKDGNLLHHIKFRDMGNWIYQKEVQAKEGTHIRLTSNYRFNNNDHIQHFKGQPGEWTGANIEQLIGGTTGSFQKLRLVYDFKTNHLTAAWLPPSSAIGDEKSITADMLLIRHAQEAAQQITFTPGGSIADVKTIVGAIEFRESEIVGHVGAFNNTTDAYRLLMYYISFPFDVAVNDIYGFGQLNKEWYLQYYDGADRAARGFFGGDGTTTFWKFMNLSDTLKANVGYSLLLDNDYFNTTGEGTVWNNTLSDSIYLYFPSVKEMSSKTVIASGSANLTLPEHTCPHDRGFTDLSGREVNHMFTDSHWNMMGVPLFQNQTDLSASFNDADTYPTDFANNKGYFFEWDTINNVFVVASANDYVFKSMHGYMVQYAGNVSFSGSSMQPVPAAVAARRLPSQEQYQIDLQMLRNNERVSRTFVELQENACDTFALNEDMYMITNSRPANLYTFAGNYDVSANVLSVNNHIVEVGTIVRNSGTYRFTMPSEFDGSVVLIDTYTGARTNLALGDYEVNLERGTINDRFLLEINIHNAPTAVEGIEGGSLKDGKAHKFVQNGVMYILRDGKLFDARGAKIK